MSEASEEFNALPYEQRLMLGTMLLEAELRLIEQAKKQLTRDHDRAIYEHNARAKLIREEIERRAAHRQAQQGDSHDT